LTEEEELEAEEKRLFPRYTELFEDNSGCLNAPESEVAKESVAPVTKPALNDHQLNQIRILYSHLLEKNIRADWMTPFEKEMPSNVVHVLTER